MNRKTAKQSSIASICIMLALCITVIYKRDQAPVEELSLLAARTVMPIKAIVQAKDSPPSRPVWKEEKIDPFRLVSFTPPPARLVAPGPVLSAVAEHVETPPFPYQFFGQMINVEGHTLTFLMRDGTLVPVHASQVLDQTYRIDSVSDKQIKVTYLPLDEQSTVSVQTAAQ